MYVRIWTVTQLLLCHCSHTEYLLNSSDIRKMYKWWWMRTVTVLKYIVVLIKMWNTKSPSRLSSLISTAAQRACKPRAWSASAKCGVQWLGERRADNRKRLRVQVRWARGGRSLRASYGAHYRAVISTRALVLNTHFTVHLFLLHSHMQVAHAHSRSEIGAKLTPAEK